MVLLFWVDRGVRFLLVPVLVLAVLLSGCSALDGRRDADSSVVVLYKGDGLRPGLSPEAFDLFALFEVGYTPESAALLWEAVVPEGLPLRSGDPARPGRYGQLSDLDPSSEVLVVFSSGESGSCPEWVSSVSFEEGVLEYGRSRSGDACTDDFVPYHLVLAVDRSVFPTLGDLPLEDVRPDGQLLGVGSRVVVFSPR